MQKYPDRVLVLTYSINIDWRGVCPNCAEITLGENVVDTSRFGKTTTRIYAACEPCGWEGLGVVAVLPTDPTAPSAGAA